MDAMLISFHTSLVASSPSTPRPSKKEKKKRKKKRRRKKNLKRVSSTLKEVLQIIIILRVPHPPPPPSSPKGQTSLLINIEEIPPRVWGMGDYTLMRIVRYLKSSKYTLYFKSHSLTILLKFLKKKRFQNWPYIFLKFLLDMLKQLIYPCNYVNKNNKQKKTVKSINK